jgi:hypothetical protein
MKKIAMMLCLVAAAAAWATPDPAGPGHGPGQGPGRGPDERAGPYSPMILE